MVEEVKGRALTCVARGCETDAIKEEVGMSYPLLSDASIRRLRRLLSTNELVVCALVSGGLAGWRVSVPYRPGSLDFFGWSNLREIVHAGREGYA